MSDKFDEILNIQCDSDEDRSQQTNELDQVTELRVETDELIERLRKNLIKSSENVENEKQYVKGISERADDYVRNFMFQRGMLTALNAFQDEWYEFKFLGKLGAGDTHPADNVYIQNEKASEMLEELKEQVKEHKDKISDLNKSWEQLKKDRDYHKMHHKRLLQEKVKKVQKIFEIEESQKKLRS